MRSSIVSSRWPRRTSDQPATCAHMHVRLPVSVQPQSSATASTIARPRTRSSPDRARARHHADPVGWRVLDLDPQRPPRRSFPQDDRRPPVADRVRAELGGDGQNGVEIGPVGERRPELLPCRCRSHGALGKVHCLNTEPDTAISSPPAWQVKPRDGAAVGSGSLVVGPRNEKSWRSGPCAALGLRADGRARFGPSPSITSNPSADGSLMP